MRIGGGIIQRESVESVKSVIWHLTPLPPRARVFIVHDDGGMKGMRLGALENHGLHGLRGPEQLRSDVARSINPARLIKISIRRIFGLAPSLPLGCSHQLQRIDL
jgi:hypothetical protein